ncbi:hypothetical protein BC938DRAFT_477711 [Jimgerdemannia flammicorona]|uniref:Autophagy-related protein 2 n=1 Tax=Jimgerdemannia flammicorona TaxID=994334 RepID=A0A433QP05_9FUNG|nr:hypothetical protein BC938DRAFT_477711 [Jimgerdemannia flammicorona]
MMKGWGFGEWTTFAIPNNIQKRLYKFLLKKAIGQFLANEIDLDSFDIQLGKGTVELRDLELNVKVLNEMIADLPLVILDGRILSINASIPWTNFWGSDCELEIRGLKLTVGADTEHPEKVKPKIFVVADEDSHIMSSSIHIAGDFLRHEVPPNEDEELRNSIYQSFHSAADGTGSLYYGATSGMVDASMDSLPARSSAFPQQPPTPGAAVDTGLEGLQVLSRLIDKIMAKVKVTARDTLLRVHHRSELHLGGRDATGRAFSSFGGPSAQSSRDGKRDYYIDFVVPIISYCDETPGLGDETQSVSSTLPPMGSSSILLPPVTNESIKVVSIESPTVWIREADGAVREEDGNENDAVSVEDDDEREEFFDSEEDVPLDGAESARMNPAMGRHWQDERRWKPRTRSPDQLDGARQLYSALIFSTLDQSNRIKIKLRPNASPEYDLPSAMSSSNVYTQQASAQNSRAPAVEVMANISAICTALCPEQVVFLAELAMAIGSATSGVPVSETRRGSDIVREPTHQSDDIGLDEMEEVDLGLRPSGGRGGMDRTNYGAALHQNMHSDMPGGFGRSASGGRRGNSPYEDQFGGMDRSPFKTPAMQSQQQFPQQARSRGYGSTLSTAPGVANAGMAGQQLAPTLKFMLVVQSIECFFLYRDPASKKDVPKQDGFFTTRAPESLEADHLKIEIDELIVWYYEGEESGTKRQSEAGSVSHASPHRRPSSSPSRSSSRHSSSSFSRPKNPSVSTSSSSRIPTALELNLTNFAITEWLSRPPPGTPSATTEGLAFEPRASSTSNDNGREQRRAMHGSRPVYRAYNPILEFDNDLMESYDQGGVHAVDFPTFYANKPRAARQTRQAQQAAVGGSARPASGKSAEGVFMVKLEKGKEVGQKDTSSSSTMASAPAHRYDQDIAVKISPFHLHVDLRMADRLEHYLAGLAGLVAAKADDASLGQLIINDLDDRGVIQVGCALWLDVVLQWIKTFTNNCVTLCGIVIVNGYLIFCIHDPQSTPAFASRLHVNCTWARIWLLAPDMSGVNLRDEITDSIHAELLILDIVEFVIRSTTSAGPGTRLGSPLLYERSELNTDGGEQKPKRVNVECESINLFLKFAEDHTAICWFTAKPDLAQHTPAASSSSSRNSSTASKSLPNIEITFRPSVTTAPKISSFDSVASGGASSAPGGIAASTTTTASSTPFPQLFATVESDQNVRSPAEDEEEEILAFKERTIATSLFVADCHFPITRIHLTKRAWDTIQIIQNDLQIWQPRFIATAAAAEAALVEASIHSEHDWSASSQDHFLRRKSTSGFRQAYEEESNESTIRGGPRRRNTTHTMASISMSEERFGRDTSPKPTLLSLVVHMVNAGFGFEITPTAKEGALEPPKPHLYQLSVAELRWFSVAKHEGKNDSIICFDMEELELRDSTAKVPIFYRTIPKNVKLNRPMFSLVSHLQMDSDLNMQDKNTDIVVAGITWRFTLEPDFIEHLLMFQQVPEDMVLADLPSQYTKVFVTVNETSVDYKPINLPSRAVVVVDNVKVTTSIIPDSPTQGVKVVAKSINALIADDARILNERNVATRFELKTDASKTDAYRYWHTIGFANMLSVEFLDVAVRINKGEIYPRFELELMNQAMNVEACADSFQTALELINYMATAGDLPEERRPQAKKLTTQDDGRSKSEPEPDIFASLDEKAFAQKNPIKVAPDQGDDLSNLDLVEDFYSIGDKSLVIPPKKPKRKIGSFVSEEDTIRLLEQDLTELVIVEDHFAAPKENEDEAMSSKDLPNNSMVRVRMKEFNITLNLFDGFDWERTREDMRERLQKAKLQAKRAAESGEAMSRENSNSSLSPPSFEPRNLHLQPFVGSDYETPSEVDFINDDQSDTASQASFRLDSDSMTVRDGKRPDAYYQQQQQRQGSHQRRLRLKRSTSSKIEFRVERLGVEFDLFPNDQQIASRLLVTVRDFEIIDNVKTSLWRKFLSHMRPDSDTSPRESKSNMVRFELSGVRPAPDDPAQEYRLKAKLLPMRLYVDQDALDFLIRFLTFMEFAPKANKPAVAQTANSDADSFFFQHVEVQPISIKLDYKPKHVDYNSLKEGKLVELMNFLHIDSAEMTLRAVKLTGVKGWGRLIEGLSNEWLPHIKNTQVPHMVSGVAPIRSLVNVGSGVADLVLLPIEQYKKDGRIIKGLQKGTQSFAKATTMEAIKLGTKLAAGTQVILEQADVMLGGKSTPVSGSSRVSQPRRSMDIIGEDDDEDSDKQEILSKFADQPADLTEGLEFAYRSLRSNIGTAAQTIYAVPMEVYETDGASGTARAVIRAVPVAVIKPMIGVTEALSNVLLGLRNTIDPSKKLQNEDKYKRG